MDWLLKERLLRFAGTIVIEWTHVGESILPLLFATPTEVRALRLFISL